MPDKNGNENALEGYQCPRCGNHSKLTMLVECVADVSDDGTDNEREFEWDDESWTTCPECEFSKPLSYFKIPEDQ